MGNKENYNRGGPYEKANTSLLLELMQVAVVVLKQLLQASSTWLCVCMQLLGTSRLHETFP